MTDAEVAAVTRELERVRDRLADISEGVGEVKTLCAVLVERSTRTDQDVRQLREDMETEVQSLRSEVAQERAEREELQRVRWRVQGAVLGGTVVLGGSAGYLAQAFG